MVQIVPDMFEYTERCHGRDFKKFMAFSPNLFGVKDKASKPKDDRGW